MFDLENLHVNWNGEQILDVYKPFGLTPKEIADKVKEITKAKKAAFSGRLDPMAHGLLKIFLNDACIFAQKANNFDKVYRFKFAFNVSTSSGDLLGYCNFFQPTKTIVLDEIITFLKKIQDSYWQQVPMYSSLPLSNKDGEKHPLWWWAKKERLSEIKIPSLLRRLYSFEIIGFGQICLSDLVSTAKERITKISPEHDFNQQKIINTWLQAENNHEKDLPIVTFEMTAFVSSGFYIRQLISDIGNYLNIPTTTLEIERLSYC